MVLVSYSDSEASDEEKSKPSHSIKENISTTGPTKAATDFSVDKSNPRKIKVNLQERKEDGIGNTNGDGERAPKRPRVGPGAFSGFNAMLPAPKRDAQTTTGSNASKGTPRKVFSIKTGAEPGFSRESDAELRSLFAEQEAERSGPEEAATNAHVVTQLVNAQATSVAQRVPSKKGSPIMFKPLSVARNPGKKKKSTTTALSAVVPPSKGPDTEESVKPRPKLSLFSTGSDRPRIVSSASTRDYEPIMSQLARAEQHDLDGLQGPELSREQIPAMPTTTTQPSAESQSLDTIATELNLSAAERRQLFGRDSKAANAINIVNFNTDKEYAANEALRASGEQVQHNPVRAIAPGKHSLKQLVSAASGQKDALEESFASGKRNKKEAGSKYGW